MRPSLGAVVVTLCLGFTAAPVWAGDSHSPHVTIGPELRGGTLVGHSSFAGGEYLTLGGLVALGQRLGPITIEVEYDYLTLQSGGAASKVLGTGHRLGANARVDILRIGRGWVGNNSLLIFWADAGVGRQWTHWTAGPPAAGYWTADEKQEQSDRMEALSTIPVRHDVVGGFGLLLDHRFAQPLGFPSRVGWDFGWRLVGAPGIPDIGRLTLCRDGTCTPMTQKRDPDIGLLVHSSLLFTW
jgi:hypothetical protein